MTPRLGLAVVLCILSTASTHAPPCAADEVLDTTLNTCSCNLNMYTSQATPPTPLVQCLSGQMKISEDKCQLEKSGFNSDNLHLRDPTCVGTSVIDVNANATVIVSTNTTSTLCGNTLTVNGTHATYSNQLLIPARVSESGLILRQNYTYNVSCSYPLNMQVALATALKPILGCPSADLGDSLTIRYNGNFSEARFEITVFKITDSDFLYLFADLTICKGQCIPTCNG